jgi:hypothetical protein
MISRSLAVEILAPRRWLLFLFIVSRFSSRHVADCNMRDHMMEIFGMLSGIVLTLTVLPWLKFTP